MAYENIQISVPIFCLGPQSGTFCYILTNDSVSRLIMVSSTGTFLREFVLSSRLLNPLISLEYVGPKNLSALYKGLTFFTLEHLSGNSGPIKFSGAPAGPYQALVKRWELDPIFSTLNLKQSFVLNRNAWGMAVEHYNMNLSENCPGNVFFVEITDASRVEPGMRVTLGPSTDLDNPGAVENLVVSYVSGNKIYFTSKVAYQYVVGNKCSFFKNLYILSKESEVAGSLSKYRAQDGSLIEFESNKGYYASATNARWSQAIDAVALIYQSNMVFKRPYDYYLNWKSINLNNELNGSYCEVYDVVFDNTEIFKLMRGAIYKTDAGDRNLHSWTTYNYQPDTLSPYTNSIQVYAYKSHLLGALKRTTFFVKICDQFGISLRDVNVNFYIASGDMSATFDPLDGQIVTDSNGEGSIVYENSGGHQGATYIRVRAAGSSAYTGSQYVWTSLLVHSYLTNSNLVRTYAVSNTKAGNVGILAQSDVFKSLQFNRSANSMQVLPPFIYIDTRTYFMNPRGGKASSPSSPKPPSIWFYTHVNNYSAAYWPQLQLPGGRGDGPPTTATPTSTTVSGSYVLQIDEFRTSVRIVSFAELVSQFSLFQKSLLFSMFFSQLKLSKHSHVVDGVHYFDLLTNARLNQFVFVEDAIPKFWSEKNPIETYIWIRLRPFAFNLNNNTFRFWVRELWSEAGAVFDTGYYEVTSQGTISNFSAGGGLLGIEFRYQPSQPFHYGSLVFVHLEVYDVAADPNFIYLDYWFKCIPDYKSPYLVNLSPGREEQFVSVDTDIYFEIKDDGAGINIDTLEVFMNSKRVQPTEIIKFNNKHYAVRCELPQKLFYDKSYFINVVVADMSSQENYLRDSYRFYTRESDAPYFTDFDPKLCLRGMNRFYDVSFVVLAEHLGVDKDSIRLQVAQQDVTDKTSITPIIYRIS